MKTNLVEEHLNNLKLIFDKPELNTQSLLELTVIEHDLGGLNVQLCNGDIEQEAYEALKKEIAERAFKILGKKPFLNFNGDPRGYALKIDNDYLYKAMTLFPEINIYRDMGGYGIVMPEEIDDLVRRTVK